MDKKKNIYTYVCTFMYIHIYMCYIYMCIFTYMCVCIYIRWNHLGVHQKLTQYCKSITLQLKKKPKSK